MDARLKEMMKQQLERVQARYGPEVLWAAIDQVQKAPAEAIAAALTVAASRTGPEAVKVATTAFEEILNHYTLVVELTDLIISVSGLPPDTDDEEEGDEEDEGGDNTPNSEDPDELFK